MFDFGIHARRCVPLICALALTLPGCTGATDCAKASSHCTNVLLIGNSFTYVNDLPGMFSKLASSGGHPVKPGMLAAGGATLADHVSSVDTARTLSSTKWNFVVL